MSSLKQIRRKGFTLRAVENGLYIEPIDKLTEADRLWLIDQKSTLRAELLVERWQWFISLAAEHGIHPDVVGAGFPTEDDRLGVVEPEAQDDDKLRAFMEELCEDQNVKDRQAAYIQGRWLPVDHDGDIVNKGIAA